MKKILKKTAAALLTIIMLFFGLTMIGEVAPHAFDNSQTVQAGFFDGDSQIIQTAHAQTATTKPTSSDKTKEIYNNIISVIVVAIELLSTLLWPILLLIGALLQNDILFSGGMEQTMLNIWVNIRNLVNILFVLVLLGIAFYNVLGGSNEEFQFKSVLPKFIIALIAVNFSFLAVRVVADTVNVATIAIFALPNTINAELKTLSDQGVPDKVCREWSKRKTFSEANASKTTQPSATPPENQGTGLDIINFEKVCVEKGEFFEYTKAGADFFNKFSTNNAALVMAIDMGKILNIDAVKLREASGDPIKDLTINVLLTVILYVVYTSAFLALFVILVIRMVLLWVAAVLSPFIVLTFVLPESLKSSIGGGGDLTKKLVQSLIAPVPIALMMTIGFIMFESLKISSFGNSALNAETGDFNLLTSGISTLQDLIIAVGMVAVIWMGVFAAASGTFAEEAVNTIKGAVEGAGKFIATAPFKYMPLIPVKQGSADATPISLGTAVGAIAQIPNELDSEDYKEKRNLARKILGKSNIEDLDFTNAKTPQDIAKAIKIAGFAVDKPAQERLHQHLKSNPRLAQDMARQFGMDQKAFMAEIEKGTFDQSKLRQWSDDNGGQVAAAPPTPNTPQAFNNATAAALSGAPPAATPLRNTATTLMGQVWSQGTTTAADQLDTFVTTKQPEIATALTNAGVAPTEADNKAKAFLLALLTDKMTNEPDATKKTQIQAAITKLQSAASGGTTTGGTGGGTTGGGTAPPPSTT